MADDTKAILRIVAVLAIGLVPALGALVLEPSRGIAVAASGSAAMAIAFVLWTQRLAADVSHLRAREKAQRVELASLEEHVQDQARELRDARLHDDTTGALNRTAFLRRLDEAIARDTRLGKPLAYLVVDIEGFKAVNAERGRITGDAVLKRVAHVLVAATRGTDSVGRLGGDEFGVVLNECDDPGPAVNRVFSLLQAATGDGATAIHVSIGAVTIPNPAAGVDIPELVRLADAALASVRGTGGSRCARRELSVTAARETATA
jgi:diguanylate cyclase (GGDEF)-like protein